MGNNVNSGLTKPIRFFQIAISGNHIYGLDQSGHVWYRHLIPFNNYSTTSYNTTPNRKDEEKKAEERIWKSLDMEARVEIPIGLQQEITQKSPSEEEVESVKVNDSSDITAATEPDVNKPVSVNRPLLLDGEEDSDDYYNRVYGAGV